MVDNIHMDYLYQVMLAGLHCVILLATTLIVKMKKHPANPLQNNY